MERIRRSEEMNNRRSANILAQRFVQRWDVHGLQLNDGRYICKKEPLTGYHLIRHLKGEITLGVYVLNSESRTHFTVIDADDDVQFHQLFKLADELAEKGIPSHMEASRRGGHLWFFYAESVSGREAKTFGEELLPEYQLEPMEVFPKQEELGDGPGSLIRLPFGIHRKSGKRYPFVNREDGMPAAESFHEQILQLRDVRTVPNEALEEFTKYALKPTAINEQNGSDSSVWSRIRAAKPAIDFIGRYIELTPTPTGGIGYCPFHEDEHKSFGVHKDGNFWHCFAGCGGGSIIDFWSAPVKGHRN